MNPQTLAPQDLVRKAVIEVAQLPENELLVVIEMVDTLKKQRTRPNRETATQIVVRAKARAAETSHLSREEIAQQFSDALEAIRAEAIAKGTAIEGEWEGD
jgi:dihydroxyacetone kinase